MEREIKSNPPKSWLASHLSLGLCFAVAGVGVLVEKGPILPFFGPLITAIGTGLLFYLSKRYWVRRIGTYLIAIVVISYLVGLIQGLLDAGDAILFVLFYATLLGLIAQDVYRFLHRNASVRLAGATRAVEAKEPTHREQHVASRTQTSYGKLENKAAWRALYVIYLVAAPLIVVSLASGLTASFVDSQPYSGEGGAVAFTGYALICTAAVYGLYRFLFKRMAAYIVYGGDRLNAGLSYSLSLGWALLLSATLVAVGMVLLLSASMM
jgi:hypothetical protein